MKMKNKLLVLATILLSLAMLSIVSASNITLSQNTIYLSKAVNSSVITLTNTGDSDLNLKNNSPVTITNKDGTDSIIVGINVGNTTIPAGNSTTVNLQITSGPSDWRNFKAGYVGSNTVLFKNETGTENATLTIKVVNDFCKYGEVGYLEIGGVEDNTKDNEDEWVWHPLDAIKITVNSVYNGFDKDKNIRVEYALYDGNGKKVDFGNIDTYTTLSIKSDHDKDVVFEFQVPADIDEGTYYLFVKAYIKNDEDVGCTSIIGGTTAYFQEVTIEKENDRAVVVDRNEINSIEASCSETVNADIKVYNIGTEDEDKVLVNLYNKELGINLYQVITDLGKGDSDTATFSFDIPTNAAEKTYYLDVITLYNYDDDNSGCNKETDVSCYDENSIDDLDKEFRIPLIVKGNCAGSVKEKDVSITAQLITAEDEVKAGNEVQIKATYTNTGNKTTSFIAGISGYEDWASIVSIEPQSFEIVPGESRNVLITLKLNKDASGDKIFKVRALFDGDVKEKAVSLSIAPATKFNLPGIFQENKLLFWIVVVNVILIILIIIVAIKVARS